jgi:hypothetical protein
MCSHTEEEEKRRSGPLGMVFAVFRWDFQDGQDGIV